MEKLAQVLNEAGFREALHIPEPPVFEFQRDSEVVTVQNGHTGANYRLVAVESETVDVDRLVAKAGKLTVIEVARELLGSLPQIQGAADGRELEARLADLLLNSRL